MTDEGKEREETLRALMEMAWRVGFERVPIPPEKADEARALLREHDARTEARVRQKAAEGAEVWNRLGFHLYDDACRNAMASDSMDHRREWERVLVLPIPAPGKEPR